ncbi:2OG-Fe dioxygenase family protein [Roseomonas sp. PWR1]|uniref:2OG-Fe dioxygenase family protein n=1 Tax=Roseomonas nitratireducens TaxID=2820810 RepID=A0ABS4AU22_9PROT|nr:2OG-Fe dioxygenase family protein [Neoroseomonas nitratireducens]MBP0464037.1 2OG-Fe dioxygenase family protein [Neoroseomonas nitratireducens]
MTAPAGPLADLAARGFARIPGAQMATLMGQGERPDALAPFFASWNRLETDAFMADGGRYRRRRIANFAAEPGVPGHRRGAHRPHFQAVAHNTLNGGVDRWFAPMEDAVAASAPMVALLGLGRSMAEALHGAHPWFVEAHQFRIEAAAGTPGFPTPEGVHHDGVDCVLIAMIARTNLAGGETVIEDDAGARLAQFVLSDPLDTAVLDDPRVRHGVTPVAPADPGLPSCRDVLVLTWKRGAPP